MKLDWNQIAEVAGTAVDVLRNHFVFESISSTNDWHAWSGGSNELPAVCLAECQDSGRGRNGKAWVSLPDENIYLTLVWSFKKSCGINLAGLSLAVGVVIARLVSGYGEQAKLKWPNDVMVGNSKLAGILIETKITNTGSIIAIIGIGLNFSLSAASRQQINRHVTDFVTGCVSAQCPDRNQLAGMLIKALVDCCQQYAVHGFNQFRDQWQAYDMCMGRVVNIKDASGEWSGTAQGINEQCALIVMRDNVEHVVHAADVSIKVE